ncbi:MAG: WhiB family transcriptional regulator [Acidimicrobiia bacterium]
MASRERAARPIIPGQVDAGTDLDFLAGLAATTAALAWQKDAVCREHVADVEWFPTQGRSAEPARAICKRCLVRVECLEFAIDNGIVDGVWGGTTGAQRDYGARHGLDAPAVIARADVPAVPAGQRVSRRRVA